MHRRRSSILGGQPDTRPEHQAIVYLMLERLLDRAFCTGTLISPRVVLTAAHCCREISGSTIVSVGFGEGVESMAWLPVSGYVIHPQYRKIDRNDNDVCLILLAEESPADVVPIPHLPSDLEITGQNIGDELEFVGFGLDESDRTGRRRSMTNRLYLPRSAPRRAVSRRQRRACPGRS